MKTTKLNLKSTEIHFYLMASNFLDPNNFVISVQFVLDIILYIRTKSGFILEESYH